MTRRFAILALGATLAACSPGDSPRPVAERGSRSPAPGAPPAATTADPNDPAEPGLQGLPRLARYVFRAMQQHEAVCPFENPFRDGLRFAFAIDVAGGRMTGIGLGEVALESPLGRLSLLEAQWPRELTEYVSCLAPHLEALVMAPAPADGAYRPIYSFASRPGGKPLP